MSSPAEEETGSSERLEVLAGSHTGETDSPEEYRAGKKVLDGELSGTGSVSARNIRRARRTLTSR